MALLRLEQVWKSYTPKKPLLKGVNWALGDADRVALVGANGSGKSTLLRLLAGLEVPDEGRCIRGRDVKVGYLPQQPVLAGGQTVFEAVEKGLPQRELIEADLEDLHRQLARPDLREQDAMNLLRRQGRLEDRLADLGGTDVRHQIERFIENVGLKEPQADCAHLSGGEKRRVALAQLMVSMPDVLLLDEPTNHLDVEVTDWLEDWLLQTRLPFLLITHDRYFLERVVTHIVELDRGELHTCEGNYAEYLEKRMARLRSEQKSEASRLLLLRRETEWIRRGPPARSTKAKARIRRYEELRDAAVDPLQEVRFKIPPGPRLGEKVIELDHLSYAIDERLLIKDLEFLITRKTRLGIVGPNGAGKTTLLKLIGGALKPSSGEVRVGPTVRFARVDQERSALQANKALVDVVATSGGQVRVGERLRQVESFLEQFLFPRETHQLSVQSLSGGEQNRLLLACLLCAGGNCLILDEPTNDLDLPTLRVLEEALISFPGAILAVSHDRYFLDRFATDILYLDGTGGCHRHQGDLSMFLQSLRSKQVRGAESGKASQKKKSPERKLDRPKKHLTYKLAKELETLPARIEDTEAQLAAIDEQLSLPATYQDAADVAKDLSEKRQSVGDRLEEMYRRWDELESYKQMDSRD